MTTVTFYAVRPECQDDVPKTKFKPKPGKTLSARRWHAAFSEEGYLDIAKVLSRIQRGGVHPSIKGVVWEFLLGCYDPKSTFDERGELRLRRREQYGTWKAECQAMEPTIGSGRILTTPVITDDGKPVQDHSTSGNDLQDNTSFPPDGPPLDKKVIQWKLVLHQIGLDVVRTDRALTFYENQENDAKLWDILSVYAWMDKDIGYCQGMSDLCSPMVMLFDNEADSFWCFERLMRRMRENFRSTSSSIGVQSQLSTLSTIIKAVDPKLHQHLENLDGGEYLFAFRMLMVLFRREFSFVDSMYLWELMWAMEYNPNIFSLYEDESGTNSNPSTVTKMNDKLLKQYGKYERKNVQTGSKDPQTALSIFLIAGVLENRNKRLLKEAKGLDDVVKILNEITGNLDAKKACNEALKLHKKYLSKTKK
ncbi:rab GTPase-activating protein 22-like isoform X1 [Magnolia sinica]|uniref:rab GTPase-activating protein 22-like isoform X1 n=1 Tax=Magnolia sinica TaxID=86752 RepID=UPI00265B4C34|nr:rab GTPase-activating protein 22-like isoform X1 [Magnolia sinica]